MSAGGFRPAWLHFANGLSLRLYTGVIHVYPVLFIAISVLNAVPLQITQQGRLLDGSGASVTGVHTLTFRVYTDVTGGSVLWSESLSVQFNNGYYATVLGTDTQNNFDSDTLLNYPIYLEVQLDANTPMSPRHFINSAPYAQIAGIAESVEGGSVDADNVSIKVRLLLTTQEHGSVNLSRHCGPMFRVFRPVLLMMSTMSFPVVKSSIMLKTNRILTWQTQQQWWKQHCHQCNHPSAQLEQHPEQTRWILR